MVKTINFFDSENKVLMIVNGLGGEIIATVPYADLYHGLDIDPPEQCVNREPLRIEHLSEQTKATLEAKGIFVKSH